MTKTLSNGIQVECEVVDIPNAGDSEWVGLKVSKIVGKEGNVIEDKPQWWVVHNDKEQPICVCGRELDCKMVVAALTIATSMGNKVKELNDLERKVGEKYDTKKLEEEIRRLKNSGMTEEEVLKNMTERRDEFLIKPKDKKDDDFIPEGW